MMTDTGCGVGQLSCDTRVADQRRREFFACFFASGGSRNSDVGF